MEFTDKYTTTQLLTISPITEKNKTVINPDAYAIGEIISELIKKIEHARMSLMK